MFSLLNTAVFPSTPPPHTPDYLCVYLGATPQAPVAMTRRSYDVDKKLMTELAAQECHEWFTTHRFWEENKFEYMIHPSRQSFLMYSHLGRYDYELPYYEILFCYTNPSHRSEGMLTELLATLQQIASTNGKFLLAQSRAEHVPHWERRGFQRSCTRGSDDSVCMIKTNKTCFSK